MRNQKGFSLLEILVTLVILSFGLLGIAGIIVNSLKSNQSSYSRTQASWLANDIIDRMRANRSTAEVVPSPYSLAMSASAPTDASIPSVDLKDWRDALASALPSGAGSVAVDATSSNVTVVVQWDNSHAVGGASNEKITVESHL